MVQQRIGDRFNCTGYSMRMSAIRLGCRLHENDESDRDKVVGYSMRVSMI